MQKKILLATIDTDLKIRTLKNYPLSANGRQIHVVSGGEAHFMPLISNTSYLEFPYRAMTSPWKTSYRRIYFAMNKAKKCVDFQSGEVPLPSPEEMKKALASTMLAKIGKPEAPFPVWVLYLILLCVIGITLKVFEVIA
jgi:hypothetical protein